MGRMLAATCVGAVTIPWETQGHGHRPGLRTLGPIALLRLRYARPLPAAGGDPAQPAAACARLSANAPACGPKA